MGLKLADAPFIAGAFGTEFGSKSLSSPAAAVQSSATPNQVVSELGSPAFGSSSFSTKPVNQFPVVAPGAFESGGFSSFTKQETGFASFGNEIGTVKKEDPMSTGSFAAFGSKSALISSQTSNSPFGQASAITKNSLMGPNESTPFQTTSSFAVQSTGNIISSNGNSSAFVTSNFWTPQPALVASVSIFGASAVSTTQPMAFGSPVGANAAPTSQPLAFGSSFGASAASTSQPLPFASGFGASGVSTPQTSTFGSASTFGQSSFGSLSNNTPVAFSSNLANAPVFGSSFASQQQGSSFGAVNSTQPQGSSLGNFSSSGNTGFGTGNSNNQPVAFGSNLAHAPVFGSSFASQGTSFGAPNNTQQLGSSFGNFSSPENSGFGAGSTPGAFSTLTNRTPKPSANPQGYIKI